MSDNRMAEASEIVDAIHSIQETIKDHEANIRALREDVERRMDRLRLLVEGTGVSEIAGAHARAKFTIKVVPKVADWQALYGYIEASGAWDLLHKRIGASAWQERVNMGMTVPGVEAVVLPNVEIRGKR